MTKLEKFRAEKDEFFAKHMQSPLSHAQKHDFKGLKYYPENPSLRLEVKVEVYPNPGDHFDPDDRGGSPVLSSATGFSNSRWRGRRPN